MSKRIVHKGDKFGPKGAVSALCFQTPRAINMKTQSWTLQAVGVTCEKCLKLLQAKPPDAP